ncbi:MAG: hypothetical protein D6741_00055 [Planctomycetota bacterium]|nr:MAG: hypothetical protein D6741_00055 [Planctomycetota bacterium]
MPYQDLLLLIAVIGLWYALNRWILPAFGIPTCMSGGCCSSVSCSIDDRETPGSAKAEDADAGDPVPEKAKSEEVAEV